MKAKEWIMRYGLEHYARHNLRKDGKRGRELDYELVRKYRKRYGTDIPLKPPKRYYYAVWNIDYSFFSKLTGEQVFDRIENVKSALGRWEALRENRKEELSRNLEETFETLRRERAVPTGANLEGFELVEIKQITQRTLEDFELEEKLKPKRKPPKPKPEPEIKEVVEPSEREIELRERELELREREMELRERKLSMAKKFLEKGYSPKEIKELLDTI